MSRINKSWISRLLSLSRTSAYYQPQLPTKDELLKNRILAVLSDNPSYGHRRIALALNIGRKRARRVMSKYGLKPYKRKARWGKRRDIGNKPAPYPNLIKHIIISNQLNSPNLVWVSDFTYIKHQFKYLYLATYMDLFTREIIGWSLSNKHDKQLVISALLDGLLTTSFQLPKIVHSDQGSEYTCKLYTDFISYLGIQLSMSKKASPWENGYQESFYNNFKTDLGLEFDRFNTVGELIEAVHQTINYYNNRRIHTSLKTSPRQFREMYRLQTY